ncbi:hypothetical protein B0172_00897 [Mycobacterium avium subsp. paratuberculosis]|nr:hypothetical protein B0172_00897 [Mycobacterium avium subsp. paratuberculosis]OVF03732.1 hypothetical protein B0173_02237 [Mycobacterium avium subsp. paratuberculosis]
MTAPEHDDRLEPYRRMWVLRLLDMALDESGVGAAIDDDAPVDFGQEAVAVGAVAALRPGDLVNATTPAIPARPADRPGPAAGPGDRGVARNHARRRRRIAEKRCG